MTKYQKRDLYRRWSGVAMLFSTLTFFAVAAALGGDLTLKELLAW